MQTPSFFSWVILRIADALAECLAQWTGRFGSGSILQKLKPATAKPQVQIFAWFLLVVGWIGYMAALPELSLLPGSLMPAFEVLIYTGYFLATLRDRNWAVPLFLFFLPFLTYRPLFVLLCLMILLLFVHGLPKAHWQKAIHNRFHLGVAVFLFFFFLTSIASAEWKESLTNYLLYYFVSLALYFLVVLYLTEPPELERAALGLVLGAVVVSLYGIYQYFALDFTSLKWVDVESNPLLNKRIFATFGNPNIYGQYLVLVLPIAFVFLWKSDTWLQRFRYAAFFFIPFLALILTFSRGSWLALFVGGSLLALMLSRRLFLLGILAAAVGFHFLPDVVMDRILSIFDARDSSSSYRFQAWQAALGMIRDYWLTGIGADSTTFYRIYPDYMMPDVRVYHFHNIYIQHFVMGGILGLFGVLYLFYHSFKRLVDAIFAAGGRNRFLSLMAKGLFSSILALALAGLTEDVWRQYRVDFTFWAVMALAAAVYRLSLAEEMDDAE